jgi:hypothetical protein
MVQRTTKGPAPLVRVNVALGSLASENVPVPPLTTDHVPVPEPGVLPPRDAEAASAQIVCGPPTVAVVGGCFTVTTTSAVDAVHGALEIVQRRVIGPVPPVCVKVEVGDAAFENVPVPPLTTDQAPVAVPVGVLPPRLAVVPLVQIVWAPPVVAVCAAWIVTTTFAVDAVQGAFEMVHRTVIGPVPVACVKVAFGVVAFGLKEPVPPLTTDHCPVPVVGVLPPRPAVVPPVQIVCGPPAVAVVGG